jgi:hypothetical protein
LILVLAIALFLIRPGILPFTAPPPTTLPVTPLTTSVVLVSTTGPVPAMIPISIATTVPVTSPPTPTTGRAVTCPSDRRACGELCVDTLNDPINCGGCGNTCDLSQICQQGICRDWCPPGQTSCPDGCHDLLYDTANCGICGNLCPAGLACNRSMCMPPLTTAIPTYAG